MSGFSHRQLRKLATPLDAARVQTREQAGKTLSYIEGWFAIAEANRIFGYDGWDREMVHFDRLFERSRDGTTQCSYIARVRIRVRAPSTTIVREGTGFGQANADIPGEAHERALKAAETDATKRALVTFGGRFGLLLYDKEHRRDGARVQGNSLARSERPQRSGAAAPSHVASAGTEGGASDPLCQGLHALSLPYRLVAADGSITDVRSPEGYCSGLRQLIAAADDVTTLRCLERLNQRAIKHLRAHPNLVTLRGTHYADVLGQLFAKRLGALAGHSAGACASAQRLGADDGAAGGSLSGRIDNPNGGDETSKSAAAVLAGSDGPAAEAVGPGAVKERPAASEDTPAPKVNQTCSDAPPTHNSGAVPSVRLFVPVPAYPLAQIAERLQPAGTSEEARDDERAPESAIIVAVKSNGPLDEPATATGVIVAATAFPASPTRRSQISGGFSVDKSVLLLPSERRLRSKAHLVRVAGLPCLVCEELPCHAHHITFAQARGLSQKVSDEFTVPLCVVHHNGLHAMHNEASWWRSQGIEPLAVAQRLWRETANAAESPS